MFHLFRKKKVEINNSSEWISVIQDIMNLLNENGFEAQADAFIKPLESLKINDIENFIKSLNTVDIWVGSGAAWEIGEFRNWNDKKKFLVSFRNLIELMKKSNIKNNKAKSISRFFLSELERNN